MNSESFNSSKPTVAGFCFSAKLRSTEKRDYEASFLPRQVFFVYFWIYFTTINSTTNQNTQPSHPRQSLRRVVQRRSEIMKDYCCVVNTIHKIFSVLYERVYGLTFTDFIMRHQNITPRLCAVLGIICCCVFAPRDCSLGFGLYFIVIYFIPCFGFYHQNFIF